ncbi:MAG: diaminopimelate epimerase [Nitrospiraceae bacterium]|nr:diaminopimelate epimerase [Nitrospiraceae bacterium]
MKNKSKSEGRTIAFTKMQGAGNDFVLLDGVANDLSGVDFAALSKRLLDRRFGIGGDQLLVLLASEVKKRFRMRIFNADGGEVQMCGNGIRCLAKYIWQRNMAAEGAGERLEIDTLAGIIVPERIAPERRGGSPIGGEMQVRVDMGVPRLEGSVIPVRPAGKTLPINGRVIDHPLKVDDVLFRLTCVSMGNPHAAVFVEDVAGFPVGRYGPMIETDPLFPERTNVEFIQVMGPDEIRMRVWERGSGETLACGTGASAGVVAAALKGLTSKSVKVLMPGGELHIEWAPDGHVYMTGPAEEVFEGKIVLT